MLALGAVLRVWQYLANTSLWIDEAALARNIVERDALGLLRPLAYAQVAPPGFLLVQKAAVSMLGSSEYVLRAFPLACGLVSLLLFTHAARRVLSGWAVSLAIGLFAAGIPFIYVSSTVKQYASDVAIALALLVASFHFHAAWSARGAWLLGLGGMAAVAVSQTAVFVVASLGAALAAAALSDRDRRPLTRAGIVIVLWAAAALASGAHALITMPPVDREYFQWFWRDGFMPLPPRGLRDVLWLPDKLTWIFGAFASGLGHTNGGLQYRWSPLFVVAMLFGFWTLWQKNRVTASFLIGPLAAVLICSAAWIYPFTARLTVFMTPFLLLATAAGVERVVSALAGRVRLLGAAALAIYAGAPAFALAAALPPTRVQDLRTVLDYIGDARRPGDRIYVYYGAEMAFRYYAARGHLAAEHVSYGGCHLADPRGYFREFDTLRGMPRVWIVVTHAQRVGELDVLLGYLDALGRRLDAFSAPSTLHRPIEDASAYLYDLSETGRPSAISAETYAVTLTGMDAARVRWGCYGVTGGGPPDRDAVNGGGRYPTFDHLAASE